MTKEDFIREVQKLDGASRKDAIEGSDASPDVKAAVRQQTRPRRATQSAIPAVPAIPRIVETRAESASPARGRTMDKAAGKAPSPPKVTTPPTDDLGETAVERKRRLAVLANQGDDDDRPGDDVGETPAERRRRQAALGMGGAAAVEDSDSEDEGTPRVPPARRGIRFAEPGRR